MDNARGSGGHRIALGADDKLAAVRLDKWAAKLDRAAHVRQLKTALTSQLPKSYERKAATQTWMVYWTTHSLALLEQDKFLDEISSNVIEFLAECAHPLGGYGGGPGQIAHMATSFAAVNALVTLSSVESLEGIDRIALVKFMHRMKQSNGSFAMHDDGEIDSRATYCALAMIRCLSIEDPILMENVADWILACQTYEGGFGSVPGSEAHGGYTFCCVASLCLVNALHRADLQRLLRWLANKQLSEEGGFCGRSNKLVDSCYSYWQGAVFPLLQPHIVASAAHEASTEPPSASAAAQGKKCDLERTWLYDCGRLQDYVLNQCQAAGGLLCDKPGVAPDAYHTCYALSGLSISQHQPDGSLFDLGDQRINELARTHPLFNLTLANLEACRRHFGAKRLEIARQEVGEDS